MRPLATIALLLIVALIPSGAMAKKKKKYAKQVVDTTQVAAVANHPKALAVTDPTRQLYGEWTITQLRRKPVLTQERPYVYLDFANNRVYGNNGCNSINGRFDLHGFAITFHDMVATDEQCHNSTSERTIMKTLSEVRTYAATTLDDMVYLDLLNSRGTSLLTLQRLNFDLLSGAWTVTQIAGDTITPDRRPRLVIDPDQLQLHGQTSCNTINGIITIDPNKKMAIQFDDIRSTGNRCEQIGVETALLIALEQAERCRRIDDNHSMLIDGEGRTVLVLERLNLKR